MLKELTIVIPSMSRSHKQTTVKQLPKQLLGKTSIAVPCLQVAQYQKCNPMISITGVPDAIKGISHTRKYLMEQCKTRYLMMLDDDMKFAYRTDMKSPTLTSLLPESNGVMNMILYWYQLMSQYAHVGLSARQGNNRVEESVKECTRMFNAYTYDLKRVWDAKVIIGRLPVMEDFDLTLQLLRKGIPNAVIYRWCWNQSDGSNAPGGCSSYRTASMQQQAAEQLSKLHPGFVRVVEKESTNWDGMNKRMDATIYWKKAYESSLKNGVVV